MQKVTFIMLILVLILSFCTSFFKKEKKVEDVKQIDNTTYECTFDEEARRFLLYLPQNTTDEIPLIMMLHGTDSNANEFEEITHFEESALKRGYAVCYVNTLNLNWNYSQSTNFDDSMFIIALTEYIEHYYNIACNKVYACGYSDGGFMVHNLALNHPGTFSGVASIDGTMHQKEWDDKLAKMPSSVLEIYECNDSRIPQESNGTASDTNYPSIEEVINYYVDIHNLSNTFCDTITSNTVLTKYEGDFVNVWTVMIESGNQSWPTYETYGFDANELILDFFDSLNKK